MKVEQEKKVFQDILNLILIISSDGLFYLAPIIYPYITFYYKNYNKEIDMNNTYTAFCGSYFGRIIANLIIPSIIFKLGTKKTIQIGGLLYFVNFFCFAYFPCKISLFLNSVFYGFVFQFKILPINYYISKKYKKGILYLKHVYVGFNISAFFWTFVLFFIVNPKNIDNVVIVRDGFNVYSKIIDQSVYDNVPFYFYLNGFVGMVVTFYCSGQLEENVSFKEECSSFLNGFSDGNGIELSDVSIKCLYEKKFETSIHSLGEKKTNLISQNSSDKYFITTKKKVKTSKKPQKNSSPLKSKLQLTKKKPKKPENLSLNQFSKKKNKLSEKFFLSNIELTIEQAYKKARKEMFTSKFFLLLLIVIFKSSSSSYFMAYTKYISYSIIKNDKEITFFLAFMNIPDIIGRYLFSYLWKKFGFFKTTLFSIILTTSQNILFIFFGYNNWKIFLLLIFVNTINYTTMLLLSNMTLFSFYDAKEALILSRVFEFHSFLSRVYSTVLNWIFLYDNNFTRIFIYFSVGEIISFALFYKQFKDKKFKARTNQKFFF